MEKIMHTPLKSSPGPKSLVLQNTKKLSIDYLINTCQSCIQSTDEKRDPPPPPLQSQPVSLPAADLDLHS